MTNGQRAVVIGPVDGIPRGSVVVALHHYAVLEKWFVLAARRKGQTYAPTAYVRERDLEPIPMTDDPCRRKITVDIARFDPESRRVQGGHEECDHHYADPYETGLTIRWECERCGRRVIYFRWPIRRGPG